MAASSRVLHSTPTPPNSTPALESVYTNNSSAFMRAALNPTQSSTHQQSEKIQLLQQLTACQGEIKITFDNDMEVSIGLQRIRQEDLKQSYSQPPASGNFALNINNAAELELPMELDTNLCLTFSTNGRPALVQVFYNGCNVLNGEPESTPLRTDQGESPMRQMGRLARGEKIPRQNYMVIPDQRWVALHSSSKGDVSRFSGDAASHIQIKIFPISSNSKVVSDEKSIAPVTTGPYVGLRANRTLLDRKFTSTYGATPAEPYVLRTDNIHQKIITRYVSLSDGVSVGAAKTVEFNLVPMPSQRLAKIADTATDNRQNQVLTFPVYPKVDFQQKSNSELKDVLHDLYFHARTTGRSENKSDAANAFVQLFKMAGYVTFLEDYESFYEGQGQFFSHMQHLQEQTNYLLNRIYHTLQGMILTAAQPLTSAAVLAGLPFLSEAVTQLQEQIFSKRDALIAIDADMFKTYNQNNMYPSTFSQRRAIEASGFRIYRLGYYLSAPDNIRLKNSDICHFQVPGWQPWFDCQRFAEFGRKSFEVLHKMPEIRNELLAAAECADAKAVQILSEQCRQASYILNLDFNLNPIKNTRGETLLMLAAGGDMRHLAKEESACMTVEFLLNHGADPEAKSNIGRTALMDAAMANRSNVARLLVSRLPLERRVEYVNRADDMGETAQLIAQKAKNTDFLRTLDEIGQAAKTSASSAIPVPGRR